VILIGTKTEGDKGEKKGSEDK